ncbi:MAG: MSMEG_4193 family putative phosphomutase [Chloroflexi bacterium]|nr:MSMEG_4193 family putative phosphomutase [Chloroflexota bacterium]
MTEFLLIRHAANDFVKTGRLAGWTPDVHLNAEGRAQAAALGERLARTPLDAAYSSPLERCVETAQAVLAHHPHLTLVLSEAIGEVRYGRWQGAALKELAKRKLWRVVQITPSRARFPEGETLRAAQMRAVDALEQLAERHPRQRVAIFSHSDVIKLILAHYLGMHIDLFQRIEISPASISIVRLGSLRPSVVQINETSHLSAVSAALQLERLVVASLTLDAVGALGKRIFYLQARSAEQSEPITFIIEKAQALLLAEQIETLLSGAALTPAKLPALSAPDKVMFRIGQTALEYESDGSHLRLTLAELLSEGQGAPRRLHLIVAPEQLIALAGQARQVARRGRMTKD